jgi:hypothetical protein
VSDGGGDGGGSSNSELMDSYVDVNLKGVGGFLESGASGGGVHSNGSSGDVSRGNGCGPGGGNEDSVNHQCSVEVGGVVDRFHSFVEESSGAGSSTDKVINCQLGRLSRSGGVCGGAAGHKDGARDAWFHEVRSGSDRDAVDDNSIEQTTATVMSVCGDVGGGIRVDVDEDHSGNTGGGVRGCTDERNCCDNNGGIRFEVETRYCNVDVNNDSQLYSCCTSEQDYMIGDDINLDFDYGEGTCHWRSQR